MIIQGDCLERLRELADESVDAVITDLHEVRQTVVIRAHDDAACPANGGKSGRTFEQFPFARALSVALERR